MKCSKVGKINTLLEEKMEIYESTKNQSAIDAVDSSSTSYDSFYYPKPKKQSFSRTFRKMVKNKKYDD